MLLKMLRDRTYDDLHRYVKERERQPWRKWDGRHFYGYNQELKPTLHSVELSYCQVVKRIDQNLLELSVLEKLYQKLRGDIPIYNDINREMINFCTSVFGNEGWLQLFQLRMLRKQQEMEQHDKQYMPPVEHIKKLQVDPYTLQVVEPTH